MTRRTEQPNCQADGELPRVVSLGVKVLFVPTLAALVAFSVATSWAGGEALRGFEQNGGYYVQWPHRPPHLVSEARFRVMLWIERVWWSLAACMAVLITLGLVWNFVRGRRWRRRS